MLRCLLGALALALSFASASHATEADTNGLGSRLRSLPMDFEWRREGPTDVCGNHCRTWIAAVGTITADTPHEFQEFVKKHDAHGATLVLDSGGGSVHGALALGREIRALDITTTVGRTLLLPGQGDQLQWRAKLSPRADCESMCVFLLLAGAKRSVPPQARVMVHQIWLGDRRDDAVASNYSAEDLVLVQRDIGRLAVYTIEMGGRIELLDLALRIPPWEPMHQLSRAELRETNLIVGDGQEPVPVAEPPVVAAATNAALVSSLPPRGEDTERSWTLINAAGEPTLTRRHPLTVEGDEIGSFDVTLSCGAESGQFNISYSERRNVNDVVSPLSKVTLPVGSRSQQLGIVSSEPISKEQELSSLARGQVSADFLRAFTESDRLALVVSTSTKDQAHTMIRVGNSGITLAFNQLAAKCGSTPQKTERAALAPTTEARPVLP